MKRKRIKIPLIICIVFILVFYLCLLYMLLHDFLRDVIPHSRQNYRNHESFVEEAEPYVYQKELPTSAQNIRYYYYEGMFKDKSCYHVSLSQEDYRMMKQEREVYYSQYCNMEGGYLYNGQEKKSSFFTANDRTKN